MENIPKNSNAKEIAQIESVQRLERQLENENRDKTELIINHNKESSIVPRIYVASLADYNA